MKKIDLLKAMNDIDEQFITEADPYRKKVRESRGFRLNWRLVSVFAVLLLAVGIFRYPLMHTSYDSAKEAELMSEPAPADSENAPAPKPDAAGEQKADAGIGFDSLPETMNGGTLLYPFASNGHTVIANYVDEKGILTASVYKSDSPFEENAGDRSEDSVPSENSSIAETGEEKGTGISWEADGWYYRLRLYTENDGISPEQLAETIR